MNFYEVETTYDVDDEGSDFVTATITFADGRTEIHRFARFFDDAGESAAEQAASFLAALDDAMTYTLEERLGAFGIEWEREQEERGAYA